MDFVLAGARNANRKINPLFTGSERRARHSINFLAALSEHSNIAVYLGDLCG
jgi:hypothetical protein